MCVKQIFHDKIKTFLSQYAVVNILKMSFSVSVSDIDQLEELMGALEKTRQELDATKLRLTSTQQSLRERDGHLSSLRVERRKQLEEILEMK